MQFEYRTVIMKKNILTFLSILLLIYITGTNAQQKDSSITHSNQVNDSARKGYVKLDDGDSVWVVNLPAVEVIDALNPLVVDNMKKYLKLRRDVIRAYPYAKLASATLKSINDSIAKIPKERARKKYIKQTEKTLKAQFEAELRKLTVNQGRVLLKLIDRETGDTSYEVVKELRGTFEAFFWQTMAKFFGSSLKSEYDPLGEDQVIESIVQAIERGEIPIAKK